MAYRTDPEPGSIEDADNDKPLIQMISYMMTEAVAHNFKKWDIRNPQNIKLTNKQRDVLRYFAHGLKNAEVNEKMGISESAVRLHVLAAMHKLDAKTKSHAIALAVFYGLI
ncbi:response regulator transcription factor [Bartonella choladocola]|uniref:response regulator transcription factor n=1 Tax=Bartonella choladocola TaxID=2750995 RepID=UPI0016622428|nr:LuxR C-terminal-related transcriptional regulator [Bartonella choladocola]